ncbi:M28 family peptidase [Mongoliitalea daihaiensis]|uniref:M28 family peptidase n=1 Tax=Mongoliitalea daihaiensis TaxID=2782006 RepID=UPI001F23821F|nr:M28 family peptidase [Mongoliitalea daihaiensis]UJP66163.1 M28 family peptidase [Mongoliitalea daihaiensis]
MYRIIGYLSFVLFFMSGEVHSQQVDSERLLADLKYLASETLEGRKPLSQGSLMSREFIRDRFKELQLTSQYEDYTQFFDFVSSRGGVQTSYEGAANIIGFIPGALSEKIIVVMAHYDHLGKINDQVFLGADDNASGTAAVLALAEYFSTNRPQHSMLFALVDAEEMGHHGSKALVQDFPFPMEQVALCINMDMVSRSDDNVLWAVGTNRYPQLKPLIEPFTKDQPVQLKMGHDNKELDGLQDWTFSSDHAAFHRKGVPFIYFGVDDHEDYHKVTDTFENIQPEFFVNAVNLILKTLISMDEKL